MEGSNPLTPEQFEKYLDELFGQPQFWVGGHYWKIENGVIKVLEGDNWIKPTTKQFSKCEDFFKRIGEWKKQPRLPVKGLTK